MSISYKKVNEIIFEVIDSDSEIDPSRKEDVKKICQRIYTIVSSVDHGSRNQIKKDIRNTIAQFAMTGKNEGSE